MFTGGLKSLHCMLNFLAQLEWHDIVLNAEFSGMACCSVGFILTDGPFLKKCA